MLLRPLPLLPSPKVARVAAGSDKSRTVSPSARSLFPEGPKREIILVFHTAVFRSLAAKRVNCSRKNQCLRAHPAAQRFPARGGSARRAGHRCRAVTTWRRWTSLRRPPVSPHGRCRHLRRSLPVRLHTRGAKAASFPAACSRAAIASLRCWEEVAWARSIVPTT